MDMVRKVALAGGKLGQAACCLSCCLAAARTSAEVDKGRPPEWGRETKQRSRVNEKTDMEKEREGVKKNKTKGSKGKGRWKEKWERWAKSRKKPSYVGSESREELLRHMETDCLEQGKGRIFATAGVKYIVLFEAHLFKIWLWNNMAL